MSEQQTPPASDPGAQPPAAAAPKPGPASEKQPPWGEKPEDFNPDKAWELIQNLRNERKAPDPALKQELETLRAAQQAQQDAIAKAFGVKPSEVSDTDKLAEQVGTLQQQILASERRALAAEHKVPESLLTATDAAAMKAQAEALVEFATAAHVAAATATPPPAFQANPGQGLGGAQLTPEAQAAAEYEKYYPPIAPRR
jgi:hypothetical protein